MRKTYLGWLFLTIALAGPLGFQASIAASREADAEVKSDPEPKAKAAKKKAKAKTDEANENEAKGAENEDSSDAAEKGEDKGASKGDDLYKKALKLQKAKKYKEAFVVLKAMSRDEADKSRAFLLIGTLYHHKKKYEKAKAYFDQAGQDPILSKETAYAYGATYLEYEDFTKAIRGLKSAILLKSGRNTQSRYKLGVAYYRLGQYLRAEKFFERVNPKALASAQRLERQRYLLDIRSRHDALLSSLTPLDSDVSSVQGSPRAFGAPGGENDWGQSAKEKPWGIRWKPSAMLYQESHQNLNKGNGRDATELLSHRVGTRAYAGDKSSGKTFGSLGFGLGYAGFDVKQETSRSFVLSGASGEFLSQSIEEKSEENIFVNFQPLLNWELSSSLRAEFGAGLSTFLPHGKTRQSWGQIETFGRLRGEWSDLDGGLELALQQPYDTGEHAKAADALLRADVNKQLGEMKLRFNLEHWGTNNEDFTAFNRERMSLTDSRFKYHLGFKSETKVGFTGALDFGELGLQATYEFISRAASEGVERLSANDDPELVAKQSNKRMFAVSYPLWDVVSLTAAFGSQNLSGYTFRQRDSLTQVVQREFVSDITQSITQLGATVSLLDWLKLRLAYTQGRYSYKSEAAKDDEFKTQNPRAQESSIMHIELSKSF